MEACKASSLEEVMDKVAHADIGLDWGPFMGLSEGFAPCLFQVFTLHSLCSSVQLQLSIELVQS